MPARSPVRLLVKVANPVPSIVIVDKLTVGLIEVDHTTPLAITTSTIVELIAPPLIAPLEVMELTALVEIGSTGSTFKVSFAINSLEEAFCVEEK